MQASASVDNDEDAIAPPSAAAPRSSAATSAANGASASSRPRTLIHFKKNSKHAVSQALAQLGWAEVRLRIPPSGNNKRRAVPSTGLSAAGSQGAGEADGGDDSEEDAEGAEDLDAGPSSRAEPIETPRKKVKQPRALLLNLASYAATVVSPGVAAVPAAAASAGSVAVAPVSHLNWDIAWVDLLGESEYASIGRLQRLNQFPHMHKLSKKKFLALHLNAMRGREEGEYAFYPRSWVLPQQLQELKQYYAQLETNGAAPSSSSGSPATPTPGSSLSDSPVLIVKPDFCCEGRGIYLVSSLSQIDLSVPLVVQQYLSRPLLLGRQKFDLRLYVLLLSVAPLSLALYDDGLTRVCTEEYVEPSAGDLGNLCQHLTNYAINKKNEKFVYNTQADAQDVGNKWSVKSLFAKLRGEGHDVDALWRNISDLVIKSVLSSYGSLAHSYRTALGPNQSDQDGGACFQFLGFDVMLDREARPALIEINRNCSLKCDTPLDSFVKVNAIKQTLQLVDPRAAYRFRSKDVANREREMMRGLSGREYKEAQQKLWHQRQWRRHASSSGGGEGGGWQRCSARLRYEDETLASFGGGFQRIFPLATDGASSSPSSSASAAAAPAASATASPASTFDVRRSALMPAAERAPVYDRLMALSIALHAEGLSQKRGTAAASTAVSATGSSKPAPVRRTLASRSALRAKTTRGGKALAADSAPESAAMADDTAGSEPSVESISSSAVHVPQ